MDRRTGRSEWLGGPVNIRSDDPDAVRFAILLDESRRRAAELDHRRRTSDRDSFDLVDETLDELWCALDILHDALTAIERLN